MTIAMAVLIICSTGCNKEMDAPQIKENPHRHELYRLKIVLQNAPRAPDVMDVQANYQVVNDDCTPRDPLSGARPLGPHKRVPLTLTRAPDGALEGRFYTDAFLDEDYFNLGVCHWVFVAVGIDMTVNQGRLTSSLTAGEVSRQFVVTNEFSTAAFDHGRGAFFVGAKRLEGTVSLRHDRMQVVVTASRQYQ
jgi:hypothetical protein